MKKVILWTCFSIFFVVLVQTAILSHINFMKFSPDLVLPIIVFVAISNGSITGMICGFLSGFILDFLSIAPLGLHAFIFTLIAYIIGKFNGIYNLNKFILPSFFGLVSFLFKVLLMFCLRIVFGNNIHTYNILEINFLILIAINTIFSPFIFFVLNLFPSLFIVREKSII